VAKVIDVHTHMFSPAWMSQVRAARDADFHDMEGVLRRVDALPPGTRDAVSAAMRSGFSTCEAEFHQVSSIR
jgi:hypothetical protein